MRSSPRRALPFTRAAPTCADRLRAAGIEVATIGQLRTRAVALGRPVAADATREAGARIVGVVEYRDGTIIDVIAAVTGVT